MAGDKKYTEAELKKKTVTELKELAEPYIDEDEIDDITTKAPLISSILDGQGTDDEEDYEEDDVELDDEEDDDIELPEEDEVDDVDEPAKKERKPRAKKEVVEKDTLAAKQVATELGTDAKTLRQFFRSPASTVEAVGSGGRYEFNASDVPQIKTEFEAWKAGHAARGSSRGEGSGRKRGKPAASQEIVEVEELEIEDEDLELDD